MKTDVSVETFAHVLILPFTNQRLDVRTFT